MGIVTTKQAAEVLKVTEERVRQFIREGRLPAERFGRDYAINRPDLALVSDRKPGRPSSAEKKPAAKQRTKQAKKSVKRKAARS